MIERFLRFVNGSLLVCVCGSNISRFLNLCARHEIMFWKIQPDSPTQVSFYIRLQDLYELRPYLRHLAADYLPFIAHLVKIIIKFRGLIMLLLLILFFDVIFTALPNTKLTFKSQLPGATACAAAWYVFSFGLSIYVDYFNGFSMYGSLTTIALIMLWLYFCMYIMMMAVEFNVFLEAYRNGSLNLET